MQQRTPTKPTDGGLMNKDWRYANSASTNISERFARVRAAQTHEVPLVHPRVTMFLGRVTGAPTR